MAWSRDKARITLWLLNGVLTVLGVVLAWAVELGAAEAKEVKDAVTAHASRLDKLEAREEINNRLLEEVRHDVKELLQRIPAKEPR